MVVVAGIPAEEDSTWAGPGEDSHSPAAHILVGHSLAGEEDIHLHRSSRWQRHPGEEERRRDQRRGPEEGTKEEGSPVVYIVVSWIIST